MENLLHQAQAIIEQGHFSMPNDAGRPLPVIATRDAAAVAAGLLVGSSWTGQASVPVISPDQLTPDGMAEVISGALGRTVRYRPVPVADYQATMQQYGASPSLAQDFAEMPRHPQACRRGLTCWPGPGAWLRTRAGSP